MDIQYRARDLADAKSSVFLFLRYLNAFAEDVRRELGTDYSRSKFYGTMSPVYFMTLQNAAQKVLDYRKSLSMAREMSELESINKVFQHTSELSSNLADAVDSINARERVVNATAAVHHAMLGDDFNKLYDATVEELNRLRGAAERAIKARHDADEWPCSTCVISKAIGRGDITGLPFCSKACMTTYRH